MKHLPTSGGHTGILAAVIDEKHDLGPSDIQQWRDQALSINHSPVTLY